VHNTILLFSVVKAHADELSSDRSWQG